MTDPPAAKVNAKKGDCVIFSEATTHGTLRWDGQHQRRALLYKFSPGHHAHNPGSHGR
jgi:ectoine hydroxylase-related dioxygenase (phytanoyl-CoA dioxygenase family)